MKKRLLMQVIALACTAGAYAYEAGDYLYTETQKLKVISNNSVTNGDFTNEWAGWNDETGTGAISSTFWTVQVGIGPNGENAAESKGTTVADGVDGYALTQAWILEPGTYAVTYWIRGNEAGTTSVTDNAQNYVNFFINSDASRVKADGNRNISEAAAYGTEWTEVNDTVIINQDEILVFHASRLLTGVQITGFEIHQVVEVYDTRITDRLLAYYHALMDEEVFTDESKEEFAEYLEDFEAQMEDPSFSENKASVEGYLYDSSDGLEVAYERFLEANGANTKSVTGNWENQSSQGFNKLSSIGSWQLQGGRWGFSANDASQERPANDGYVATAGIQTGYTLDVGVRLENANLPAGTYFFKIEAQAVAASNKAQPYGANYGRAIVGPSIYMGTDTTFMENDTLSGRYWKTYYKILEIPEDQVVCAGFRFPVVENTGGRYSLRNPVVIALGKSVADMSRKTRIANIWSKRASVEGRLNTAASNDTLTKQHGYPWGHAQLNDSVAIYKPVYEASFDVVKADSTCEASITNDQLVETLALLEQADTCLRNANSFFVNHNRPYSKLVTAIDVANASLNDPAFAASDNIAFKKVIDEAQAMVDAVQEVDENDLGTEFDAKQKELEDAQVAFEAQSATYAVRGRIIIANPYFTANGIGTPASGAGTGKQGWDFVNNGSWDKDKYVDFTPYGIDSYAYGVWRGNTVSPRIYLSQLVKVKRPGVYQMKAHAYGLRTNNDGTQMAGDTFYEELTDDEGTANDTIYKAGSAYVFMGENGAPDITPIHSRYHGADNAYYRPSLYTSVYIKDNTEEVDIQLGLVNEADDGVGYNVYGAGNFQLTYGGADIDAFMNGSKAALREEMARAEQLLTAANEEPYATAAKWLVVKVNRCKTAGLAAIELSGTKTEQLHATETALLDLQEVNDRLDAEIEQIAVGVEGTAYEMQKDNSKGVYNLSGQRVANDKASLLQLKKGLYIFNGRKYIVK